MTHEIEKSDREWKAALTPEQYRVLRQKGTEPPFTNTLEEIREPGSFHCAGCGAELFPSEAKFDSHCGWPSFDQTSAGAPLEELDDRSHGMIRTEVVCRRCGGHLGHLFDDGPTRTGLRYCINSVALRFEPAKGSDQG